MSLRITATNVTKAADGIWLMQMPPHQVRHFGQPAKNVGSRSVLLLDSCEFNLASSELTFDIDSAVALNVGTTTETIGISMKDEQNQKSDPYEAPAHSGPGDREFLRLANDELSDDMAAAAAKILAGVRQKSPGDLKRGQSRNFSETPDNFWYVIVQPRINELSFTVRGPVSHFEDVADLQIKDDRGNTLFKVRSSADVPAALALIFHANRKN